MKVIFNSKSLYPILGKIILRIQIHSHLKENLMPGKSLSWAASLVGLVALILIIVAIIVIRQTWHDVQKRELGMIWLFLAAGAIFVAALMMAIAAELKPNLCRLKYSGREIETSQLAI